VCRCLWRRHQDAAFAVFERERRSPEDAVRRAPILELESPALVRKEVVEAGQELLAQDPSYRTLYPADAAQVRAECLDLWLMDADGENSRLLTSGAAIPSWLPDGNRVAFLVRRQGRAGFWSVDVPSGRAGLMLKSPEGMDWPKVSPDGTRVAFHLLQGSTINVWTAPLDGGNPRQLTFDKELMGYPCWSPDGKLLALEIRRGDDTHIAVMPAAGGTPRQITFDRGQSWGHGWSPDGDRIAFAGQRDGIWNVWWVALRDGSLKRVTGYTKPNTYVRYPAWSPRGDQIVYEYAETTGNIWMIDLPQ
jgi:Tol biopolymer transport system component